MAASVARIEKDFLLKVLFVEQVPLMYLRDRREYILTLDKPVTKEISLKPNRPISRLEIKSKMDLIFEYQRQIIIFSIEIKTLKDGRITADAPEFLYRNLDRSYSRIGAPPDLDVQFTFLGDRYNLAFPKVTEYEQEEIGEFVRNMDPRDLTGLIGQMGTWLESCADGYKFIIYKDVKPSSREERLITETGKVLYLPSTQGPLPTSDPHPKKRLITEETFKRYLEGAGVNPSKADEAAIGFVNDKFSKGVFSDLWVPILFQEYVIGYIHTWISNQDKKPFDYTVVDTLCQFAAILAYSFKVNGFFDPGKVTAPSFEGKVIDISAAGLLFAYPQSGLASALLPDTELAVQLSALKRSVNTNARIVRRYRDNSCSYFGCRFLDMAPEDTRFLFEFLYGKPLTDADAAFLAGHV
ncbi:hypothetical protein AGMMS49587_18800 [Spirochaetia bacterium]|nr:hypothetical protein AGMMS49587_18800 [Spirochaetia bacterium]